MYKIVVADDHSLTLLGTQTFLTGQKHRVVGAYENGISCLNGILIEQPDIAIIDVSMPGMSGLEILSICKFKNLPVKIILLTMHREISIYYSARESECDGYVLKDNALSELDSCIKTVMSGEVYVSPKLKELFVIDDNPNKGNLLENLSKTERKVLELVAGFKNNKEIATFLFISEKTVEAHKRNIAEKLQLPKGKNILLQWAVQNLKKES